MSRATSHIDRRTLIRSGTTAAAALAAGTAANITAVAIAKAEGQPDPIYALIEAHRQAEAAFTATLSQIAAIEEQDNRPSDDHPRRAEFDAMLAAASDAESDALYDLLDLPATTRAGLAAAVRYLSEIAEDAEWMQRADYDGPAFWEALAAAIERVTS